MLEVQRKRLKKESSEDSERGRLGESMEQDRMDRIDRMNMNCRTNPKKNVRTQRYGFDTKFLGVSEQTVFCCRIEQLIWTQKAKPAVSHRRN